MNTTTTTLITSGAITAELDATVQQLSFFESNVPERFRLDDATRRRGMRHIARLKAQLEARYPSTPSPVPQAKPNGDTKACDHAA